MSNEIVKIGYTLPECKTVKQENDLFYHAAKLAEEAGEVCQACCKREPIDHIIEECIDVIWSAELIMRYLGVNNETVAAMRMLKIGENLDRGYIVNDNERTLF